MFLLTSQLIVAKPKIRQQLNPIAYASLLQCYVHIDIIKFWISRIFFYNGFPESYYTIKLLEVSFYVIQYSITKIIE